MSDPRREFVEAVRFLVGALVPPDHESQIKRPCGQHCCCRYLRRACIAFADVWCDYARRLQHGTRGDIHARCRTALLREVGLEERDGEGK